MVGNERVYARGTLSVMIGSRMSGSVALTAHEKRCAILRLHTGRLMQNFGEEIFGAFGLRVSKELFFC